MMFKAHEAGSVKEDGTLDSDLSLPLVLNLRGWEGSHRIQRKKGSWYYCHMICDCIGPPVCSQLAVFRTRMRAQHLFSSGQHGDDADCRAALASGENSHTGCTVLVNSR